MYNVTVVENTTADILNANLTIGDYIIDSSPNHLSLIIRGGYYSDEDLDKAVSDGKITVGDKSYYKTISDEFELGNIDDTFIDTIQVTELPNEIAKCYQYDIDYLKAILSVYNYVGVETITIERRWLGEVEGIQYLNEVDDILQLYTDANKLILIEYL